MILNGLSFVKYEHVKIISTVVTRSLYNFVTTNY